MWQRCLPLSRAFAAVHRCMAELSHAHSDAGSTTDAALLRGGPSQPPGGSAGPVHASFPPAGQPDLVRAAQKDEFYAQAGSPARVACGARPA